jgi:hypothetical protein
MAGEVRTSGVSGLTIKATIWDETNQRWNGSAFAASSSFSAAQWLALGVITCTEGQDSEANGIGEYAGDWPAITDAGNYTIKFFRDTVAPENLYSMGSYNPVGNDAAAIWDRVLTGATHNIANSAGRRLRNIQDFGIYDMASVWVDEAGGSSSGTVDGEDATVTNRCGFCGSGSHPRPERRQHYTVSYIERLRGMVRW